jgi:hypothetical protein
MPKGDLLPIASLTTTESELAQMRPGARAGHYSVASYFSTLDNEQNRVFLDAFTRRYPASGPPCVYTEVCYVQVHLLADALRVGSGMNTSSVLAALSGAVFKGPGGSTYADPGTNHTAARQHIGRATKEGTFEIVWSGKSVVVPDPYLVSYERSLGAFGAGEGAYPGSCQSAIARRHPDPIGQPLSCMLLPVEKPHNSIHCPKDPDRRTVGSADCEWSRIVLNDVSLVFLRDVMRPGVSFQRPFRRS